MDVQTDERLLKNIEGYLMELVFVVEGIDQVSLIADVLASVQDALRDLKSLPLPEPKAASACTEAAVKRARFA